MKPNSILTTRRPSAIADWATISSTDRHRIAASVFGSVRGRDPGLARRANRRKEKFRFVQAGRDAYRDSK